MLYGIDGCHWCSRNCSPFRSTLVHPLPLVGVHVTRSLVLCVMFCRSLFVLLYFFFWPLCCLFFLDLQIFIIYYTFGIFKLFCQQYLSWTWRYTPQNKQQNQWDGTVEGDNNNKAMASERWLFALLILKEKNNIILCYFWIYFLDRTNVNT